MALTTYQNWQWRQDEQHILWLSIDKKNASVNSLDYDTLSEFSAILDELKNDTQLTAVVIQSAKPSGFIAGADIEQFVRLKTTKEAFDLIRQGQLIFDKLAAMPIPTIAMIRGFCLGGGLELVLACRYRVAEDSPKTILGAPEVKIGIHPGWGGTVRLPQLIGVLPAMAINLTGKPVSARAAAKMGLVDAAVMAADLQHAAVYYATQQPAVQQPAWWHTIPNYSFTRPTVAKMLYKRLEAKVNKKHYPAPYAIVKNWAIDGAKGEHAMMHEAESIAQLLVTPTSRNLVRVFFLQNRLKSLNKGSHFQPQHVHVIGAGTMGGDIAAWCALRGLRVTLQDRLPELLTPAIRRAHALFEKKLKLPFLVQAAMDRLIPDVDGAGVGNADVVIEAVSENLEIKQAIYRVLEGKMKPDALLATNTSSLPLDELNQVLTRPERLVGIHFFNPVAMMQLVEVVHGEHTDPAVVDQAIHFVRVIDRLPLPVKSQPGFLVNRILMPYLMEGVNLLAEGLAPTQVDQAAVAFGMPMGPVELADTVGLDVCLNVAETFASHFHREIPAILHEKVEKGELGRKSGQGFYRYENGRIIKPVAEKTALTSEEISDRLIFAMLNESAACYREKIAADADLIDAGMIFGVGFAPFRGGPLHYAQSLGIPTVIEKLEHLQQKYGDRYLPDTGWEQLPTDQPPTDQPPT